MEDPLISVRDIAERLIQARRASGLTRQQLAKQLGITRQTVRNYENATSEAKVRTLAEWSMICEVSLEWLVLGNGPGPGEPSAAHHGQSFPSIHSQFISYAGPGPIPVAEETRQRAAPWRSGVILESNVEDEVTDKSS